MWTPHAGQARFLEAQSRYKVLACGRRWGKTDACAAQIASRVLDGQPSRQLIVAPTLDQARLLFERALELLEASLDATERKAMRMRRSPYPHLRVGEHRVMARSGHLGRALRGNEATDIVIDEAAFLPEAVITEIAMPMLATTGGRLTLISTPNGHNHFWRFYTMGERGDHGVWSATAPTSESPYVEPGFLEVQRQLISERAFRVEYEAEFLDSAGRVFPTEDIDRCLVADLPDPVTPPFAIGIDWARYSDYTAVAVVCGSRDRCQLVHLERFQNMAWHQQIARVAAIAERFVRPMVTCDATGAGDLALKMLRDALPKHGIEGFIFTAKSKTELIDGLHLVLERGALKMRPDPQLIRELQHFEARPTPSGGTQLSAVSGFHDDLVVALALAVRMLPTSYRARIALGGERGFGAA